MAQAFPINLFLLSSNSYIIVTYTIYVYTTTVPYIWKEKDVANVENLNFVRATVQTSSIEFMNF